MQHEAQTTEIREAHGGNMWIQGTNMRKVNEQTCRGNQQTKPWKEVQFVVRHIQKKCLCICVCIHMQKIPHQQKMDTMRHVNSCKENDE